LTVRRAALREYLSQIEGLLDENRLPEAAAHCHFILQQYPRHVDTYRLFGRTLLEQQLFGEAKDVFARLLSADPEDLVSHAGLALAYSEERDFESAIWHMERAFEIDPYNRAVQDELRKLYINRDGDAPPRLALTRPALARLYLRGAMYRQAANELTLLLAHNPNRLDLQLALADSLYWDSRQIEAADECEKILTHLPFCVKANAILADAWLRADRVGEARDHLRRVQELTLLDQAQLNPDSTLGRAVSNSRIELPESVQVEILEDSLAMAHGLGEADAWPQQPSASSTDGDQAPDWLLEIGGHEAEPQLDAGPGSDSEETMDWLGDAAAADGLLLDEPGKETPVDDELGPLEFDEQVDSLPEPSQQIEVDSREELELAAAALDDSPEPAGAELEALQSEPFDRSAERDDDAAMALDDLLSYIDAGDDDAINEEPGPEWLEELADGSEVADELPDWLYEVVGLDATEEVADGSEASGPFDEKMAELSDLDDERRGQHDLDAEPREISEGEPGSIDGEQDQAAVDFEFDISESSHRNDVPDWLLEADEVLEDLPAELSSETAAGQTATPDTEVEMTTWLEELSDQLEENDGEPSAPGASHDE
jgi:tetratricopeptide (TPR) repeat protein